MAMEAGFRRLGLRDKLVSTLLNYRNKGGKFYNKESLKRIYGLYDDEYKQLEPFIEIRNSKKEYNTKPKENLSIELNSADTTQLIKLRGIGSKLSMNIIGLRTQLGGFARVEQIKEVYGISVQAIIVRARTTGLINYTTYKEWSNSYDEWRQADSKINDFGHFNCNEKATRFNNLLVQGVTEKRISWSKAAELSGMKIDILKRELGELNFSIRN